MSAPLGDAEKSKGRPSSNYLPPGADPLPVERHLAAIVDRRFQVPKGDQPGRRFFEERDDPVGVTPAFADAVERVTGKAIDFFHQENISSGHRSKSNVRRPR